jgi:hypothetical protein
MFNKRSTSYLLIYLIVFHLFSGILFINYTNASSVNIKKTKIVAKKKNYSDNRLIIKFKNKTNLLNIQNIKSNM